MVKIDINKYIDGLRGIADNGKDLDLYSLKKELIDLSESSEVFEDFEKEASIIGKEVLAQIRDLRLLIKIKNLASEIKNKNQINEKLHSMHFNLNLLKNDLTENSISPVKNAINVFLYNDRIKIEDIINEINDFKAKLNMIKEYHASLLPKSLDNKLEIESKYSKHMEQLYSIHKRQKDALVSAVKLFLKLANNHIKNLKRFK